MTPMYFNRELSWIEFNARVLSEGLNPSVPLLERLRFLQIVSSNFDEFFMVRVSGLKRAKDLNTLAQVSGRVHELVTTQYNALNQDILPRLADQGLIYVPHSRYSKEQEQFVNTLFIQELFPILTPLRVEDQLPFPYIASRRLHVAYTLDSFVESDDQDAAAPVSLLQIPPSLPRVIWLPSDGDKRQFTLIDDVLTLCGTMLFPGYNVTGCLFFRVTSDADISVDEDSYGSFIDAMETVLSERKFSKPVRLEVSCRKGDRVERELSRLLQLKLGLSDDDLYQLDGMPDLATLSELTDVSGFDHLRYPEWKHFWPVELEPGTPMWSFLRDRDLLLCPPYQSIDPLIQFINDAADDPTVLAIKMTLYRTSGDSPIVHALERAARSGKQVTVFVELKARFDEQRNISWVNRLEHSGAIVIYGLVNLKVHAKVLLVVRREETGIMRYVHLSTGNYNEKTASLYSDCSLFTTNLELATDATLFFNMISGYSAIQTMSRLSLSPVTMKKRLIELIHRETACSTPESPGLIMAKMNSLCHEDVIQALYTASQHNVRILLNVRGICQLVPGIPGLSENIQVVSIVDRYLEHARICYFQNAGAEELYLSSADWMPRNLDRRVELLFPVLDKDIAATLKKQLQLYLQDNQKAHVLQSDGTWVRKTRSDDEKKIRSQEQLYAEYKKAASLKDQQLSNEFTVRRNN